MELLNSILTKGPSIKINLEGVQDTISYKNLNGNKIDVPVYFDTDTIKGNVVINLNKTKNYEHLGVRIDLNGVIENYRDKRMNSRFISLNKDILPPGTLDNEKTIIGFDFSQFEKMYESYRGVNACVRYYLVVTIASKYKNIVEEKEFFLFKPFKLLSPIQDEGITMEIGIEECLHIHFEVFRSLFHLKDVLEGNVIFKKVGLRLENMEIQIVKKETVVTGGNTYVESDVVASYEIMDGAPFKS
jgi:vacuolar protein sorting-associated protein 26